MTRILIIASETSGSRIGAALMAELNRRHAGLTWHGVGGAEMQAEGLQPLFAMEDLAVMGLAEVLPAIPRILCRLRELKAWAAAHKPDLIVTIDGQDFSKRVAQRLKFLGVSHVQYVAPKVWAWRPGRVRKLAQLYTHLLCNLPFEKPWFEAAGLPTTYVGHPMVQVLAGVEIPAHKAQQLALLPGSRRAELERHWPLFLHTYRRLRQLVPSLTGLLVLPDERAAARCRALAPWLPEDGLDVVWGEARFQALAGCKAALAKSGTNNLEMALLGVPAVVCYRMHALTFALAKRLVRVSSISLPNLLLAPPLPAGQRRTMEPARVYPEFIQDGAKPENLSRALYPLLTQPKGAATQQALLRDVAAMMHTAKPAAALAADVLERYFGKNN